MDHAYLDGNARDWGEKLKAGLEWKWPELTDISAKDNPIGAGTCFLLHVMGAPI